MAASSSEPETATHSRERRRVSLAARAAVQELQHLLVDRLSAIETKLEKLIADSRSAAPPSAAPSSSSRTPETFDIFDKRADASSQTLALPKPRKCRVNGRATQTLDSKLHVTSQTVHSLSNMTVLEGDCSLVEAACCAAFSSAQTELNKLHSMMDDAIKSTCIADEPWPVLESHGLSDVGVIKMDWDGNNSNGDGQMCKMSDGDDADTQSPVVSELPAVPEFPFLPTDTLKMDPEADTPAWAKALLLKMYEIDRKYWASPGDG